MTSRTCDEIDPKHEIETTRDSYEPLVRYGPWGFLNSLNHELNPNARGGGAKTLVNCTVKTVASVLAARKPYGRHNDVPIAVSIPVRFVRFSSPIPTDTRYDANINGARVHAYSLS